MLKPSNRTHISASSESLSLAGLLRLSAVGEEGVFLVERLLSLDPAPLISAEALCAEGYFQRYASLEARERDLMREEMRVALVGQRAVGAYAFEGIFHREQSSFIEAPAILRFLAVDPDFYTQDLVGIMVRDAIEVAKQWSHDHIAVNLGQACPEKREALKGLGFQKAAESGGLLEEEQSWYVLDLLTEHLDRNGLRLS